MIGEAAGAIAAGGVTGLAGTAISNFMEMKKQEKADKHEEAVAKIELEIIKAESERAKTTGASVEEPSISPIQITGNLSSAMLPSDNRFINFLRCSVRPVLTYVLLIYCLLIVWRLSGTVVNANNSAMLLEIFHECVTVLLYITSSCTLFWFGTRTKLKGIKQ